MSSKRPRISFVATSRNDDHGGDVLRRTQSFVTLLAQQCERHKLSAELVLVDWNPPKSRAPLSHVLSWPAGSEWFEARVVTVPPERHLELANSRGLAMFQMIAKNVGMRRASGDFIVATNIDIIFSDELIRFLKEEDLAEGVLYRSDRWDIPNAVQLEPDLSRLLVRARGETIRRNLVDGTHVRRDDGFENTTPAPVDAYFTHPLNYRIDQLSQLVQAGGPVDALASEIAKIKHFFNEQRRYYSLPRLHTNGCGDFTMLGRLTWARMRGYPEWHVFSWAIDSILLYQAHANGIAIQALPDEAVHYHIEHDYGSGWSPEGASSLWQRLDAASVPYLDEEDFKAIAFELEDHGKAGLYTVYCGLDWGLEGRGLPDEKTSTRGVPATPARTVNRGALDEDALQGLVRTDLPTGAALLGPAGVDWSIRRVGDLSVARLRTGVHPWGYAAVWKLSGVLPAAPVTIEIEYQAWSSRMSLAAVNVSGDAILADHRTAVPAATPRHATLVLKNGALLGELVCRNVETSEAEIDVRRISFFTPPEAPLPDMGRFASTSIELLPPSSAARRRLEVWEAEGADRFLLAWREGRPVLELEAEQGQGVPNPLMTWRLPDLPATADRLWFVLGARCPQQGLKLRLLSADGGVLDERALSAGLSRTEITLTSPLAVRPSAVELIADGTVAGAAITDVELLYDPPRPLQAPVAAVAQAALSQRLATLPSPELVG